MLYFHTQTGSIYAVDESNKKVCRLSGETDPTERTGMDWKQYHAVNYSPNIIGDPLWIIWRIRQEDNVAESTITSNIVKIQSTPLLSV